MEMTHTADNRELTIRISGELDHHAARNAMRTIREWIERSMPRNTILDFSGLTFMDSSGIAVVIRAKRHMEALSGSLSVVNVPRQAARVLETAGLDRYLNLTPGGEI
ncbi:MAG: STAS domain-containing protein [Oscillospiraceae bacterium]|nr:STAS domain-containing protein [Oscillospiraceae bacterium]